MAQQEAMYKHHAGRIKHNGTLDQIYYNHDMAFKQRYLGLKHFMLEQGGCSYGKLCPHGYCVDDIWSTWSVPSSWDTVSTSSGDLGSERLLLPLSWRTRPQDQARSRDGEPTMINAQAGMRVTITPAIAMRGTPQDANEE